MFSLRLRPVCWRTCVKSCSEKFIECVSKPSRGRHFMTHRWLSSVSSVTTMDSGDIELAYRIYPQDTEMLDASKKPVMFLHGLFGAKGNLHGVAKHLAADGRKIVTFDARNHGDSGHSDNLDYECMSDDLQDLIQELQLHQAVLMGHSMGGKTAMVTALNKPESVPALIMLDITPHPCPGPDTDTLKTFARLMRATKIPQDISLGQARKAVQVHLAPDIPNREILSFLLTNIKEFPDGSVKWRINLDTVINSFDTVADFPVSVSSNKSFSKPTLFVFGADSFSYKSLDKILTKQLFPKVEIEAIPGAGHFVHADKPLEVVSLVQEFLKTVDSGSS